MLTNARSYKALNKSKNHLPHTLPPLHQLTQEQVAEWFKNNPSQHYNRATAPARYELALEKIKLLLEENYFNHVSEVFHKKLTINQKDYFLGKLLGFVEPNKIIGFQNNWRSKQRDLLRFIHPNEWYLGTSHHNLQQYIATTHKLQTPEFGRAFINHSIDHIRQYIGVLDTSEKAGTVAIDNPRDYAAHYSAGHVNPKTHPSLLWRLRFPSHVPTEIVQAYINNIRTWGMLIHKVMRFASATTQPSDQLHYTNMSSIYELGGDILERLSGGRKRHNSPIDAEHINTLEASFYLPVTLGLNIPLNEATLTQHYDLNHWFTMQRIVRDGRDFWRNGRYTDAYGFSPHAHVLHATQSRMVSLETAPSWLDPWSTDLVIQPWKSQDIIQHLINYLHNHQDWNNWQANNQLADIIGFLKYALLESLGYAEKQHIPPQLLQLFDQLIMWVRDVYPNKQDLFIRIEPLLDQFQLIFEQDKGQPVRYLPPQILGYLSQASEERISLEMVGQLFHIDLLNTLSSERG